MEKGINTELDKVYSNLQNTFQEIQSLSVKIQNEFEQLMEAFSLPILSIN